MSAHSTLGPSAAERWINCPGSIALIEKAGKRETSFAAAEGSVAHILAELYASGQASFEDLCSKVGQVIQKDGHDVEITDEMVEGAVVYQEAIQAARDFFTANPKPAPVTEKFEERVHASSIHEACWGTADHYIYRPGDVLFIDDYKYGKGKVVEVEENEQASIYAIGVMDRVGDAFGEVRIRIIQPRAGHADGQVREWRTTPKALREWARTVAKPAALQTEVANAPLKAGDWCRWCDANGACPVFDKQAQEIAQTKFDVIAPGDVEAAPKRLPAVELLTVEQLAQALTWQDAIESWFVAVKARVTAMLEGGGAVPGWKLVDGRSNRRWISEEKVVAAYEEILGDKLWEKKLLSPAKLEKLIGKKTPIDHLTEKPPAKKSVAPDRDPRPVAAPRAQEAFGVIDTAPGADNTIPGATVTKLKPELGFNSPVVIDVSCAQCDIMGTCPRHERDLVADLQGGKPSLWPR